MRGQSDPTDSEDTALLRRLAHGDGAALETLMERWGDPVIGTCFRAVNDAERAGDLYAEVWAELYVRMRYGVARIRDEPAPWLVGIIGELIDHAAEAGQIPTQARRRMRVAPTASTKQELEQIDRLREPAVLREVRDALPRDFSAAADLMLLRMPGPGTLSKVQPSNGGMR